MTVCQEFVAALFKNRHSSEEDRAECKRAVEMLRTFRAADLRMSQFHYVMPAPGIRGREYDAQD